MGKITISVIAYDDISSKNKFCTLPQHFPKKISNAKEIAKRVRSSQRVPVIGEILVLGGANYRVVDITWAIKRKTLRVKKIYLVPNETMDFGREAVKRLLAKGFKLKR